MKLLRTNVRVNPRDSLGQGLDAVITLVLFFVAGFFLDRWLGTTPWMMIALTLVAAVGLFYKMRGAYDARMTQHEAERARLVAERAFRANGTVPAGSTGTGAGTDSGTGASAARSEGSTGTPS